MSIVTAVAPSVRREGRFDVAVDGSLVATVSIEAIERLRVHVGAAADQAMLAALAHEAQALHTYDRALTMLAARPRASRELHRLLVRKGEPEALVRTAIERLTAIGYLDDAAFARQFARSKLTVGGGGLSRRRLEAELARRGVARDVAQSAIDETLQEEHVDQGAVLDRLAARKARTLREHPPEVQRRRLFAFLVRRGYELDEVRAAVDRAMRNG